MARGKRTRPLLSNKGSAGGNTVRDGEGPPIDLHDDVDDYVAKRHARLQEQFDEDDSEGSAGEPEMHEVDVMPIDMSDSDSDGGGGGAGSDDDGSDDEDDDEEDPDADRHDWGVKRKLWYGGDTQDYEIMEDEERDETLREEEEEAVRLQKKALSALQPEDFRDDDDDDDEDGAEDDDQGDDARDDEDGEEVSAPEVELLIDEMKRSQELLKVFKPRVKNEADRILFHLHSTLVNNIVFYLALRTDPEAASVDAKKHPVLLRIVRIRNLLTKAAQLPESANEPQPPKKKKKKKKKKKAPVAVAKPTNPSMHNEHSEPDAAEDEDTNGHMNGHADEEAPQLNGYHADEKESKKEKKKKKKRKRAEAVEAANAAAAAEDDTDAPAVQAEDNDDVKAFLAETTADGDEDDSARNASRKRRKLNKLVGAMEREKKNSEGKRQSAADVEFIPTVPKEPQPMPPSEAPVVDDDDRRSGDEEEEEAENPEAVAKAAKKAARKARKEAAAMTPHVYRFNDDADPEEKRRASTQVVKNRGLTRHRPRDKKTPRARNRQAYSKALVRRKGAVRDYAGKPGAGYSGEASGINMSVRKGSRLSSV